MLVEVWVASEEVACEEDHHCMLNCRLPQMLVRTTRQLSCCM